MSHLSHPKTLNKPQNVGHLEWFGTPCILGHSVLLSFGTPCNLDCIVLLLDPVLYDTLYSEKSCILGHPVLWDLYMYIPDKHVFWNTLYSWTFCILTHLLFQDTLYLENPLHSEAWSILYLEHNVLRDTQYSGKNTFFWDTIFIMYICLKQKYIKQYKSLKFNTNTLFSGYRILWLTGLAKKRVPYKTLAWVQFSYSQRWF